MRKELLYNPRLLCERLAEISQAKRRRRILRGTPAEKLEAGHTDSLELLQLLKGRPPRVIFDVGAFYGTWTVLAKSIFPKAEVHAFEPLEQLRGQFLDRTACLNNVTYHQIAAGATSGDKRMELANFLDSSSLLPMTEKQMSEFKTRPTGSASVRMERLDDYALKHSLPMPDLIKLDLQGYEVEALRGAMKCLSSAQAVISEVSFAEFYKGQCLFEELVGFLASCGFRTRAFGAKTKLGDRLLQTDILFENADARPMESVRS